MSEKKMFFALEDGILGLAFEGTEEELRADIECRKDALIKNMENQIIELESSKAKIVRPANFDKMSSQRQTAIDLHLAAQVADKDAEIAAVKTQIEQAKNLEIANMKYFVLTPIKL